MTLPHTDRRSSSSFSSSSASSSFRSSPWFVPVALSAGCLLAAVGVVALLFAGAGGGRSGPLGGLMGVDVVSLFRGGPEALPLVDPAGSTRGSGGGKRGDDDAVVRVFQPHPSAFLPGGGKKKDGGDDDGDGDGDGNTKDRIRAELNRMRATVLADDAFVPASRQANIEHVVSTLEEMRSFLSEFGDRCYAAKGSKGKSAARRRFDSFVASGRPHLAAELWKYCSLYLHGGAYLDAGSPLVSTFRDAFLTAASSSANGATKPTTNVAVLGDSNLSYARSTVHGAFLLIPHPGSNVAKGMVRLLVDEPSEELGKDPLVVPRGLYALVAEECGHSPQDADRAELASGEGVLRPGENGKIDDHGHGPRWKLLEMRCRDSKQGGSQLAGAIGDGLGDAEGYGAAHRCPRRSGYCCEAIEGGGGEVVLLTRHPLLPYQSLPPGRDLPRPYGPAKLGKEHKGKDDDKEEGTAASSASSASASNAPFIATLREEITPKPSSGEMPHAPNFFDVLLSNDCLPSDKFCSQCLRNKKGATCESCKDVCPCYCNALCKTDLTKKFVSKTVAVTPPPYRRDPSRLIPRIVHQTWFEDVTKEKYPNMSRLIESWKRSGWEYRFYSDEAAQEYLSTHFPPEVREAYDSIKPGAFKADLFRYCVLLVDGGVYSDMDVLLETNLDAAVPGDVGFMTPLDEPGKAVGHRMCLWNGLIASAPGHPFLAKTIETVVNNIRNRFTSVDVDNMLCPNPELSIAHSFDILFTAGPCMLGMSINTLLGRHPQTSFEAGDVDPWAADRQEEDDEDTNSMIAPPGDNDADADAGEESPPPKQQHQHHHHSTPVSVHPSDARLRIPGRTVILSQNKWDMGAHRFTWEERNLVVAATDMPDYDDRDKLEGNEKQNHYSDTHVKFGVYGLDKLYVDREVAGEDIKVVVRGGPDSNGNGNGGKAVGDDRAKVT